jgi:hypothetical protein
VIDGIDAFYSLRDLVWDCQVRHHVLDASVGIARHRLLDPCPP